MKKTVASILFSLATLLVSQNFADEGMWPLNSIPKEEIYKKFGVNITDEWLKHVQLCSLRVSLGGSASFVSPNGLVMTNHHVGSGAIHNLSSQNQNYLQDGFYAKSYEEELPCPNLYVDQLISIRDITDELNHRLSQSHTAKSREEERKEHLANIVKDAQKTTGLQPEVVTLYQGAKYHLYLYKRYTDVRLVMAPEKSIAYFGGDADNFEFPRYCLDISFFRVYENGKPLADNPYFKWSSSGPKEGEVIFTSGHPGRTDRSRTEKHLLYMHTVEIPILLSFINERIALLEKFSSESAENRRIAEQNLFSYLNAQKVYAAINEGLKNPAIFEEKKQYEKDLLNTYNAPNQNPFLDMQAVLDAFQGYYPEYFILEGSGSRYSKLYNYAKSLVRYSQEYTKPNEMRLKEYNDSELEALQLDLLSNEPIYTNMDEALLKDSLQRILQILGPDHPISSHILNAKSVDEMAVEMIQKTQLSHLDFRKNLYEHPELIKESNDPLILFAIAIDPYSRAIREKKENTVDAQQKEIYERIGALTFARYAQSLYPDATFTLRLSFGTMQGYKEDDKWIAPTTTLGDAYKLAHSHRNQEPYKLPVKWLEKESVVNKKTPFNFVSTNDIIGGNSGSPMVNSQAEVVGIVFDGNKQSLIWDVKFNQEAARAVGVDSAAILTALKEIYEDQRLVSEFQK